MKPGRLSLILAAAATAAACAAGPTYREPAAIPGAAGPFVGAAPAVFTPAEPPAEWWRLYRDPVLDGLVVAALANNRDVSAAAANLAQVRAVLSETRAGFLPSTTVTGAARRVRQPTEAGGPLYEADTTAVGLDVAYELDFFGRVRRSAEAARADTEAARAALDVVRVSVAAETARAYADACASNQRIAVATRSRDLLNRTADLTRRQRDAGAGSDLEVSRAQAQVEAAQAAVPPLQAQRDAALFRLAVLTGRPPAQVSPEARACLNPPKLSALIPVGDGAALLRRRPDVREAERRLAAATARIGVATASLYPSVSLGGQIETVGGRGETLGSNYQFSVGPLISWSFPNIAVARARIRQADAATQAALARFDQTILVALQETETALNAYANELQRNAALRRARDQSAEAVRIQRLRQAAGAQSFLDVLDADRTLSQQEADLAQSDAALATGQIAVFKALGGGWS